ncbi:50S ribosomal protein L15 [Microbacterium sp.]|uniref:50S ribosomal protein L15 n=1 Tax=Microbacterium sp. TaxID=51671 RepID=UPI003F9A81CD
MAEKNEAVEEKAAKAPAKKAATTKAAAEKKPAAKKAPAKAAADAKAPTAEAAKKPAAKKAAPKAEAEASRPGVLKVHHLRPVPGANTAKTRVGRGEASKGKTAGRGTKGTKARNTVRVGFEGGQMPLHMRTPKLRGFKNPFRVEYQVVNLAKLAELYPSGGDVTVGDLVAKGAVRKNEKVKVLGNGDIDVKLTVTVDKVSGSAEQKIVAAGGTVK